MQFTPRWGEGESCFRHRHGDRTLFPGAGMTNHLVLPQGSTVSSSQQGGRLRHRCGSHLGTHHLGWGGHGDRCQSSRVVGAEAPLPLLDQRQQGWLIRFAIDAGQAGDRFFSQSRLIQDLPDRPLHQSQAGVAFTAHPQPEAGGMPAAGGLVGRRRCSAAHPRHWPRSPAWVLVLPIDRARALGNGQLF